ncbi:glycoside hydrolase family 31 protein [Longirhabdus pacifica]|uniref:glycoside hydrolase family 31 protein n=1 Tax=Longirhabdus pacifica TaxID=2305227 RepID=UPI001009342A|nr:TIM-barrel domain-containing protein [Longirhabdus pacifica]
MQTSETIHPDLQRQETVAKDLKIGAIKSFKSISSHTILLYGEHANVMLQFKHENILRIKLLLSDEVDESTTAAVILQSSKEEAYNVEENDQEIIFSSHAMSAHIQKADYKLSVVHHNGNPIFENGDMHWTKNDAVTVTLPKNDQSHFYGLGEKTGFLDKQNEKYSNWNKDVYDPHVPEIESLYATIPFMIHHKFDQADYGIFLDNPGETSFDMRNSNDAFQLETKTGACDYYIIIGDNMKDIISNYTLLTGRMPLPAKWSIGYHQSRYSYMNQEEVLNLARTFKEKQIPIDAIHLDIHYMDRYRVFTWDKERFPNPQQMMDELKEMGIRIITIVDPGVKQDPKYEVYKDGIQKDMFCKYMEGHLFIGKVWPGESAFPDFTKQDVREWWGEQQSKFLQSGVSGVWNDMNEPAVFNETKTMDLDVMHGMDEGEAKTHEEMHNMYGYFMSQASYEGLKMHVPNERPFVLTRAAYAGVQRYAAVWTGDNRSFWEHLSMAMPMVLNMGLSGIPLAGPDIGGFAHHSNGELLARWTQMGVFFPYVRNHSATGTLRQEPWSFGEEVEEINRKYIQMRYDFMPYIYTLFYEATQTGLPIMRPLILEYENDKNVYNMSDQFLVGSDLLVAPITRPGTFHRSVYLPEGEWYNYWNDEKIVGGQHIGVDAPLDTIPLFVKAGSLLPKHEGNDLVIHVYPKGTTSEYSYSLYEDDGLTYEYEKGACRHVHFQVEETEKECNVNVSMEQQQQWTSNSEKMILCVHGAAGETRMEINLKSGNESYTTSK